MHKPNESKRNPKSKSELQLEKQKSKKSKSKSKNKNIKGTKKNTRNKKTKTKALLSKSLLVSPSEPPTIQPLHTASKSLDQSANQVLAVS